MSEWLERLLSQGTSAPPPPAPPEEDEKEEPAASPFLSRLLSQGGTKPTAPPVRPPESALPASGQAQVATPAPAALTEPAMRSPYERLLGAPPIAAARHLARGTAQVGRGLLGAEKLLGEAGAGLAEKVGLETVAKGLRGEVEKADRVSQALATFSDALSIESERGRGYVEQVKAAPERAPEVVFQAVMENLPQLAGSGVALAKLGTAGGLASMWAQEAGHEYETLREQGAGEGEAAAGAATVGAINAALEKVPVGRLLKGMADPAAGKAALRFLGRQAALEGGTEGAQEFVSNLSEAILTGEPMDATRILESAGAGALLGGVAGGAAVRGPVDTATAPPVESPPQRPLTPPAAASSEAPAGTFSPPTEPAPEAASHAGQAGYSPEALSRVERGERSFRVTRSGEILPIANTVDTVDVQVNPGEVKARLTADGGLEIDQGSGGKSTVAQRAALSRLREGVGIPPAQERRVVEGQPEVFELELGAPPTEGPVSRAVLERQAAEPPVQGGIGEAGFARVRGETAPLPPRFEFEDEATEARFQEALKGAPQPGILKRVRESMRHAGEVFAREYPLLPHGALYAPAREALRRVSNAPGVSVQRAGTALSENLRGLTDEDYDLFLRHSLVENLQGIRETYGAETEIGFGFTDETLGAEGERLSAAIAANPRVADAVERTRKTWNAIRDETREAFAAANLPTDFLDRQGDRYLHHQILEYAALDVPGVSGKMKAPVGRGFQKALRGSEKDFNLRYAQAQGRVMAQLLADAETARQLVTIRKTYSDPAKEAAKVAAKAAGEGRSWREFIQEDHGLWQPREGSVFFTAQTLSDRLAKKIITEGLAEVAPEDLRQMLAKGGRREEYVLPKALIETLEASGAKIENDILRRLVRGNERLQRGWKVWQLLSPRRSFKYMARNFIGDAAATLQGNAGTFRQENLGTAAKELATVIFGKKRAPSPEMESWILRGGLEAGLSQQEIETSEAERIQRLIERPGFANALADLARSPQKVGRMYWSTVRKNAKLFESILRYATYRDYLSQIQASKDGKPKNYGASIESEVEAMETPEDKAYRLANELVGAYDQVSAGGQFLRREAVPFWSFQEINVRRQWRLMKNAMKDERLAEAMAKRAGIAVTRQAAMLPLRAGKFLALAYGLEAFLHAWNYVLFPDEEDELSESVKRLPHIVLGRRKNGEILYFNRLGVFQDFREWFGIDEFGHGVVEYLNGRKSAKDVAKDMVTPIVDKAVNSVGGLGLAGSLKMLTEVLTRTSTFPSATKARRITDVPDYLARSFALEHEFRAATGRPMPTGGKSGTERWVKSLPEAFLYSQDPGSADLYDAMSLRNRYLRSIGKEQGGYGFSARSNALRNFKHALRYEEPDLAKKYLFEYALLGGTPEGMEQSLRHLDPLYGLSDEEEEGFMAWLDDEEKATVEGGKRYYESVLLRSEELPFSEDQVFIDAEAIRERKQR